MKIFSLDKPSGSSIRALTALFCIALATIASAQTNDAQPVEASLNYTVKPGDKLIRLSTDLLRTPSDWAEVARFNRMKNPNALSIGQVIAVPLRLLKRVPADAKMISVYGDVPVAATGPALSLAKRAGLAWRHIRLLYLPTS